MSGAFDAPKERKKKKSGTTSFSDMEIVQKNLKGSAEAQEAVGSHALSSDPVLISTCIYPHGISESYERRMSGTMCIRDQDGGDEIKIAMTQDKKCGLLGDKVSEQNPNP